MKTISENLRASNQLVAKYEQSGSAGNDLLRDANPSAFDSGELQPDEDFEIDDTDAIYEQGPSKPLLITIVSLLTFFIGSVVFASLSQVDTSVSARGEFLTATPNVVVEASASSVVKSVEVERGDKVEKGQIIAYLDDTVVKVNLRQNQEKIDNIYQSLIRFNMEQALVDDIQKFKLNVQLDNLYRKTVEKLGLNNTPPKLSDLYLSLIHI